MQYKILVITPINHIEDVGATLRSCGIVYDFPLVSKSSLKDLIFSIKPDVIFTNPNRQNFILDNDVLLNSSVKIIVTASTGLNHIDTEFCEAHNIHIISLTKDIEFLKNVTATAEHAFGLMLSLIRKIPLSFDSVKNYQWDYLPFIGRQLSSLSVGIIGYGRLGQIFTKYCNVFFKDVFVCDPFVKTFPYLNLDVDALIKICNVVSLHVHLSHDTYHLINYSLLKNNNNEKKCLYLINTSRGSVVDEDGIINALEDGYLTGYAADVIENELSDIKNSKIVKYSKSFPDKAIITPHIGGMTTESQYMAYCKVADKFKKHIALLK